MDSILILSDEPALAETLSTELPSVTVEAVRFKDAAPLQEGRFRLILADEGGDVNALLATTKIPVIRLVRPVRLRDLLYTIGERLQGKNAAPKEDLPLGTGLKLSQAERLIRSDTGDVRIPLTEKETELLSSLMEQNGQTIARDALLKRVWGYSDDIATHTLETHIYRLRGKLRQASEALDIVFSEEGGYQLKA